MTAVILALFPELTDVNGDAQNALVLARRAEWAGVEAEVVPLPAGEQPPERPTAVVLGSTTDPALPALLAALGSIAGPVRAWVDDGVPLLAVGTGMEALGRSIRLPSRVLGGLGLLPGAAEPLPQRVADDLVVRAVEGELTGYENHSRAFRLDPGAAPNGSVLRGTGDTAGVEGVRHGSILGTRLHGPVLARNPGLADAILGRALGREVRPAGEVAVAADAAAARIRLALLGRPV